MASLSEDEVCLSKKTRKQYKKKSQHSAFSSLPLPDLDLPLVINDLEADFAKKKYETSVGKSSGDLKENLQRNRTGRIKSKKLKQVDVACSTSPMNKSCKFKDGTSQTTLNSFIDFIASPTKIDKVEIVDLAKEVERRSCENLNSSFKISNNIFLPSKCNKINTFENNKEKPVENADMLNNGENSSEIIKVSEEILNEPQEIKPKEAKHDVFQLMMSNRNKVIGSNSPGKPKQCEESPILKNKEKLKQQKEHLQQWSEKISNKRKLDFVNRDEQINNILDSRAKRLKEMLEIQAEDTQDFNIKKKSHKDIAESEEIINLEQNNSQEVLQVNFAEDNKEEEEESELINGKISSPKVPTTLSFLKTNDASKDNKVSNLKDSKENEKPTKQKNKQKSRLSLKKWNESYDSVQMTEGEVKVTIKRGRKPKEVQKEDLKKQVEEEKPKTEETINLRRSLRAKTVKTYTDCIVLDLENEPEELRSKNSLKNKEVKEEKTPKAAKKLAPVFTNSLKPKTNLNPEALAARNEFLYSGSPSKLRKTFLNTRLKEQQEVEVFPKISHVLQNCTSQMWNLPKISSKTSPEFKKLHPKGKIVFGSLTKSNNDSSFVCNLQRRKTLTPETLKEILRSLKEENSNFPVFEYFKFLRECNGLFYEVKTEEGIKKRGRKKRKSSNKEEILEAITSWANPEEDFSMWTEKYKSKNAFSNIGNSKMVSKLKIWLEKWLKFSEEHAETKSKKHYDSDSDFNSDGEPGGAPGTTFILTGGPGVGKTNAVYSICEELGINVLELNSTIRRTGKRLLQEMLEATRSHQVQRNNPFTAYLTGKTNENQKCDEKPDQSGKNKSKSEKNKMCLLLIEDADIVFDQDEGFITALNQLIATSKRPIVLIANDDHCQHLQKFLMLHPILNFKAHSALNCVVYLQLICLAENLLVDAASLGHLLEWNKGDLRRTLLQLQFWVQSGGDCLDTFESSFENSNFVAVKSKKVQEVKEDNSKERKHKFCMSSFVDSDYLDNKEFVLPIPLNLATVWWNLPDFLETKKATDCSSLDQLNSFCAIQDALSLSDFLTANTLEESQEPTPKFWNEGLKDSLCLEQSLTSPDENSIFLQDFCHYLLENQCKLYKNKFCSSKSHCFTMSVPPEDRRWRAKQQNCESVFQNSLPLSLFLDRKAFGADIYPYLRHMGRLEVQRSGKIHKRHNRFDNYLNYLDVDLGNGKLLETSCKILNLDRYEI